MKKVTAVFLTMLMGTAFLSADIYIKEKEHVGAYQVDIKKVPAEEKENEIWVGAYRAAYITPNKIYIYNKKKKKAWFADRKKKTYVEADVPLDLSKLYSPATASRMKTFKIKGTVKKTGETRTIANKECAAYKIHYWGDAGGEKFLVSKGTLWIYEDIGPGFAVFNRLMDLIRQHDNTDEAFRKEMQKVKGVQMKTDIILTQAGTTVKIRAEVSELSEKEPPSGVYEIPKGYIKKESL